MQLVLYVPLVLMQFHLEMHWLVIYSLVYNTV